MDKALKIQNGKEELVSGREIQREFHDRTPWGVSFICPLCRQPLFPAAMSLKGVQSPHFRHERNNERAHECELYASRYGYFSTYQRAPMPMFIRKSRSRSRQFIIEGGFRKLNPLVLSKLEREGAKVKIGQKIYNVTSERFGGGLTKLPFEEVSLDCSSAVKLVGSSYGIISTWGYPEDARHAMVFTRDSDTAQGKRLKIGDTIPFEVDLFLLVRDGESHAIQSAFTGAHKVGNAGGRSRLNKLAVFEVRLTKDDAKWSQAKAFLGKCGFEVDDVDSTPKIIWPPSIIASGDLVPMYENAKCIFEVDAASAKSESLYIHTSTDTAERVRTVPLHESDDGNCRFAVFKSDAKLSFVTTHNWVFSSAALLHPSDFHADEWLHTFDCEPRLFLDEGWWTLEAHAPAEIAFYKHNDIVSTLKLSRENKIFRFEDDTLDRICVKKKLSASLDQLVVFRKQFEPKRIVETISPKIDAKVALIELDAPKDLEFARSRVKGERTPYQNLDRKRALIRRVESQA